MVQRKKLLTFLLASVFLAGFSLYYFGGALLPKLIVEDDQKSSRLTIRVAGLSDQGISKITHKKKTFKIRKSQSIPENSTISTDKSSKVSLKLGRSSRIVLHPNSALKVLSVKTSKGGKTHLFLQEGLVFVEYSKDDKQSVKDFALFSASSKLVVEGTQYLMNVLPGQKVRVAVLEGEVQVEGTKSYQKLKIGSGESISESNDGQLLKASQSSWAKRIGWKQMAQAPGLPEERVNHAVDKALQDLENKRLVNKVFKELFSDMAHVNQDVKDQLMDELGSWKDQIKKEIASWDEVPSEAEMIEKIRSTSWLPELERAKKQALEAQENMRKRREELDKIN
jgi:hypothetical protein